MPLRVLIFGDLIHVKPLNEKTPLEISWIIHSYRAGKIHDYHPFLKVFGSEQETGMSQEKSHVYGCYDLAVCNHIDL